MSMKRVPSGLAVSWAAAATGSRAARAKDCKSFLIIRRSCPHPGDDSVDLVLGQPAGPVERHAGSRDVRVPPKLLDEIAALRVARLDPVERRALGRRLIDDLAVAPSGGEDHASG